MGYRWIYSITVRTLLLVGGVVLVTLGIVKYYLKTDRNGNKIDSWCHEIWKRVEMPSAYPENIIR